jgi:glycosyltransferase involved in cell wall biosynthesis
MTPRVSVLLPVRNGLPWLKDALEGLARQTLRDVEILVLEDGSTDGTVDLLASWYDDRLRILPTGGIGIAAALTVGLRHARAPLIARHDADDVSAPERLEVQADYLARHADVGMVAAVADYIDREGRPVDNDWVRTIRRDHDVAQTPEQIRALMPLTCCITHGSVMARGNVLQAAGGYRQATAPAEDYDLWLRLLPQTHIAKLPERLYRYRVHEAQVSARSSERQLLQALAAKFRYVRRVCPRLPALARLVVVGAGRGAAAYRALATSHGFELRPPVPALAREKLDLLREPIVRRWTLDSFDTLVVSDFASVPAYTDAFQADAPAGPAVRVGNFFVPRRGALADAA